MCKWCFKHILVMLWWCFNSFQWCFRDVLGMFWLCVFFYVIFHICPSLLICLQFRENRFRYGAGMTELSLRILQYRTLLLIYFRSASLHIVVYIYILSLSFYIYIYIWYYKDYIYNTCNTNYRIYIYIINTFLNRLSVEYYNITYEVLYLWQPEVLSYQRCRDGGLCGSSCAWSARREDRSRQQYNWCSNGLPSDGHGRRVEGDYWWSPTFTRRTCCTLRARLRRAVITMRRVSERVHGKSENVKKSKR